MHLEGTTGGKKFVKTLETDFLCSVQQNNQQIPSSKFMQSKMIKKGKPFCVLSRLSYIYNTVLNIRVKSNCRPDFQLSCADRIRRPEETSHTSTVLTGQLTVLPLLQLQAGLWLVTGKCAVQELPTHPPSSWGNSPS